LLVQVISLSLGNVKLFIFGGLNLSIIFDILHVILSDLGNIMATDILKVDGTVGLGIVEVWVVSMSCWWTDQPEGLFC
jgi:hypothetical protein